MKTRHLGKALVGLVAAAAAVGLLGLPASANTAEITGGTLDLFASDSTTYHSQSLATGSTTECAADSGTINANSTGAWNASFSSETSAVVGGTHFTIVLTISLSGAITTGGALSGSGTATAQLYRNNSTCTRITTTPCTISVTGISVAGTSNVTGHVVQLGDVATVSGNNGDHGDFGFEVAVSGTATDCGTLFAVDDGSVSITNVAVTATS